jgi:hypothetical protein
LAQRGSGALPSCDVAFLLVRCLPWNAVSLPPLGSGHRISLAHLERPGRGPFAISLISFPSPHRSQKSFRGLRRRAASAFFPSAWPPLFRLPARLPPRAWRSARRVSTGATLRGRPVGSQRLAVPSLSHQHINYRIYQMGSNRICILPTSQDSPCYIFQHDTGMPLALVASRLQSRCPGPCMSMGFRLTRTMSPSHRSIAACPVWLSCCSSVLSKRQSARKSAVDSR